MTRHTWWYLKQGWMKDEPQGPFDEDNFLAKVRAGTVSLDTPVFSKTRTAGKWYPLSRISGFVKVYEAGADGRKEARRNKWKERKSRWANYCRSWTQEFKDGRRVGKVNAMACLQPLEADMTLQVSDGSNPGNVQTAIKYTKRLMTPGEYIEYVVTTPGFGGYRSAVVATNLRLILLSPAFFFRVNVSHCLWRHLKDVQLKPGWVLSTFSATLANGSVRTTDCLTKKGAAKLYSLAAEKINGNGTGKHSCQLEQNIQFAVQVNACGPGVSGPNQTQRILTLKAMLDSGVISQRDFEARKQAILNEI